jgi:anti-sigma regulatory factor (Ser/Thr protein kinase)
MTSIDPPVQQSRRRSPAEAPELVDVDQPFDVDGLYALRQTLAAHASRYGAPGEQIDHLLIVASELASNAVRHGGGSGRLRLWQADGMLYCQVADDGVGLADMAVGTVPPEPTSSDGGRGIWICRHLTDELVIQVGPNGRGTTVTAAIPPPTGAA